MMGKIVLCFSLDKERLFEMAALSALCFLLVGLVLCMLGVVPSCL